MNMLSVHPMRPVPSDVRSALWGCLPTGNGPTKICTLVEGLIQLPTQALEQSQHRQRAPSVTFYRTYKRDNISAQSMASWNDSAFDHPARHLNEYAASAVQQELRRNNRTSKNRALLGLITLFPQGINENGFEDSITRGSFQTTEATELDVIKTKYYTTTISGDQRHGFRGVRPKFARSRSPNGIGDNDEL
jgi:hypothetical protein